MSIKGKGVELLMRSESLRLTEVNSGHVYTDNVSHRKKIQRVVCAEVSQLGEVGAVNMGPRVKVQH